MKENKDMVEKNLTWDWWNGTGVGGCIYRHCNFRFDIWGGNVGVLSYLTIPYHLRWECGGVVGFAYNLSSLSESTSFGRFSTFKDFQFKFCKKKREEKKTMKKKKAGVCWSVIDFSIRKGRSCWWNSNRRGIFGLTLLNCFKKVETRFKIMGGLRVVVLIGEDEVEPG